MYLLGARCEPVDLDGGNGAVDDVDPGLPSPNTLRHHRYGDMMSGAGILR